MGVYCTRAMTRPSITVSVVSHGQNALVNRLYGRHGAALSDGPGDHPDRRTSRSGAVSIPLRRRTVPAHRQSSCRRDSVPITTRRSPVPRRTCSSSSTRTYGCSADPLPRSPAGSAAACRGRTARPEVQAAQVEDSARRFPTVTSLVRKSGLGHTGPDYPVDQRPARGRVGSGHVHRISPRGLCGRRRLRRALFPVLRGCRHLPSLRTCGYKVLYDPTVSIVHEARRASRRDPRLMRIHAASVLRYLLTSYGGPIVITPARLIGFLRRGPRHVATGLYYAARAPKARCFPLVAQRLNGHGLEIGGPSRIFGKRGLLPVYPSISALDNCNFGHETVWEGRLTEGPHFKFGTRIGSQFVSEAFDLKVPDASYDFVLSSHMLEHSANPIRVLLEWLRVLKPGGHLLLVLPEARRTWDRHRPVTRLEHLLDDFRRSTPETDRTHSPRSPRCMLSNRSAKACASHLRRTNRIEWRTIMCST